MQRAGVAVSTYRRLVSRCRGELTVPRRPRTEIGSVKQSSPTGGSLVPVESKRTGLFPRISRKHTVLTMSQQLILIQLTQLS